GHEHLAFFDAISPIVLADTIDMSKVFRASRWNRSFAAGAPAAASDRRQAAAGLPSEAPSVVQHDEGLPSEAPSVVQNGAEEGDYLNCPLDRSAYDAFYDALVAAEKADVHDFDN